MINLNFHQRKDLINSDLMKESENIFILEEKIDSGKAKLKCILSKYSLAFLNVDKNRFPYIQHAKCADSMVFKRIEENRWELKIIEFKKTISPSSWEKSKKQYKGALVNAVALAGVLGIGNFESIEVYSAFREDKLSVKEIENPILLKLPIGERPTHRLFDDWEKGYVEIDIVPSRLKHNRIHLDDEGNGEVAL